MRGDDFPLAEECVRDKAVEGVKGEGEEKGTGGQDSSSSSSSSEGKGESGVVRWELMNKGDVALN